MQTNELDASIDEKIVASARRLGIEDEDRMGEVIAAAGLTPEEEARFTERAVEATADEIMGMYLKDQVKALILEADLSPFKGDRAKLDAWVREHFPEADFDTINDAIGEAANEKRAEGEHYIEESRFLMMISELRDQGGRALDKALSTGEVVDTHLVLAAHIVSVVHQLQGFGWDRDKLTHGVNALITGFNSRRREILSTPMAEGGAQ